VKEMFLNRKAQSTLEYAVLISVVVAALLGIQIYVKRGVQGRLRSSTDQIGEQFDAKKTSYTRTSKKTSTTVEEVTNGLSAVYMGADSKGAAESTNTTSSETVSEW